MKMVEMSLHSFHDVVFTIRVNYVDFKMHLKPFVKCSLAKEFYVFVKKNFTQVRESLFNRWLAGIFTSAFICVLKKVLDRVIIKRYILSIVANEFLFFLLMLKLIQIVFLFMF